MQRNNTKWFFSRSSFCEAQTKILQSLQISLLSTVLHQQTSCMRPSNGTLYPVNISELYVLRLVTGPLVEYVTEYIKTA